MYKPLISYGVGFLWARTETVVTKKLLTITEMRTLRSIASSTRGNWGGNEYIWE